VKGVDRELQVGAFGGGEALAAGDACGDRPGAVGQVGSDCRSRRHGRQRIARPQQLQRDDVGGSGGERRRGERAERSAAGKLVERLVAVPHAALHDGVAERGAAAVDGHLGALGEVEPVELPPALGIQRDRGDATMADRRHGKEAGIVVVAEEEEQDGRLAGEAGLLLHRRGLPLRVLVTADGGG
jgi:hypothetical protein